MDLIATDIPQLTKLFLALFFVVGTMWGLSFALKKMGLSAVTTIVKSGDKRRLSIVESLHLDARRRLVILKCDNQEYLVILGANGETVISHDLSPPFSETVDSLEKPVC